jgi:hypothetical protein
VSGGDDVARAARERAPKAATALIAAYRQGLGLAPLVAIGDAAGLRLLAGEAAAGDLYSPEAVAARFWCRNAADARRVAAAAMRTLLRRQVADRPAGIGGSRAACAPGEAVAAIERAAERLNVALYTDEHIAAEAARIVGRVQAELTRMRESGELKSVNGAYRAQRMQAKVRGEKFDSFPQWFAKYEQKLVRELAAALRYS